MQIPADLKEEFYRCRSDPEIGEQPSEQNDNDFEKLVQQTTLINFSRFIFRTNSLSL